MAFDHRDVRDVADRGNVGKGRARQALEVVDGDAAAAVRLLEDARMCGHLEDGEFKPFDPFGKFAENAEFLADHGGVSVRRAATVLRENDGFMLGAQEDLDAYRDETSSSGTEPGGSVTEDGDERVDNEKSFRERVEEIRERRAESGSGANTDGETTTSDGGDEDKSFRERVEEIRERRKAGGGKQQGSGGDGRSSSGGEPAASGGGHPRGTVVVPRNKHFLQKLEARARDGQANLVETAYALTGETYTHPTELIPLDNREFYLISTRTQTGLNVGAMANEVARSYPGVSCPNVIAKFHTHPGGVPEPSPADQGNARQIYRAFVGAFGSDDFEFFHGIHSLREHGRSPGPAERQQPSIRRGRLVWDDEQFRHSIAVYGPDFRSQKSIVIEDDTA